jgi:uncharacterized protein (UPF0216 family)
MDGDLPYERMLHESLKDELRIMNAYLPCMQKSLADLLKEESPSIPCNDGSNHLFKKKELTYLTDLISKEDQAKLLLPIIIKVTPGMEKTEVVCQSEIEERLFSKILGMKLTAENSRINIYAPQLAVIRKILKTTTQYLFSPRL